MLGVEIIDLPKVMEALVKAPEKGVVMFQKIAMELYRSVVLKSPVDTGRFRANWQVSIDQPITTPISSGASVGANVISSLTKIPKAIFLSNNVPYAHVIEYGLFTKKASTAKTIGGYSRQAPQGVARISVDEIKARFA